jgi:transposase
VLQFYCDLHHQGVQVRVGMEASGHSRWFERLVEQLGFELWIGDPAEIRTRRVRRQKTDRQDAELLLQLMTKGRFRRIWVPDGESLNMRQLLWHRHRLVQMRTRVVNQLHAIALIEGLRGQRSLWRSSGRGQLEALSLAPWAARRRQDLLELLDRLQPAIAEWSRKQRDVRRWCGLTVATDVSVDAQLA